MSGWSISATGTGGTLGALVLRDASGTAVGWLNAGDFAHVTAGQIVDFT